MTERLTAAVSVVCPIHGVSVRTPGDSSTVRIDFRYEATPEQRAAAQAVVDGFDWSEAAQSAWELTRNRTTALTTALTRRDDTAITVRAWLVAITKLVNDRLESLGQTRVLESDILAYIAANPTLGDPLS